MSAKSPGPINLAGREIGVNGSERTPEEREAERQQVREQSVRRANRESQGHDHDNCRCWACIYLRQEGVRP